MNNRQTITQHITLLLSSGKQKKTIDVLDGVRAVACFSVIIFHVTVASQNYTIWQLPQHFSSLIGAVALYGQSGVILFFLLSGFLLFLPYARALLFDSAWPSFWQFYLRRTFRIVPAYYLTLFLMIIFSSPQYFQPAHLHDLWLFLTFRMDFPATFQKIDGPFWTLAVEFQFYILLPLIAWLFGTIVRRGRIRWRLIKLGLCLFALFAWGILSLYWGNVWWPGGSFKGIIPSSIAGAINPYIVGGGGKFLEVFAVGMLICTLYIYIEHRPPEDFWVKKIREISGLLFFSGLIILGFMTIWHFYAWDGGTTFHLFDRYRHLMLSSWNEWESSLYAIGFGLCTFALLYAPRWLKGPFAWSPLRWVGFISFSLYMWHVPLIDFFMQAVIVPLHQRTTNLGALYGLVWIWVLLAIIPFSCVLYLLIEKPGMQLGEKLRHKLAKQPVAKQQSASLQQPAPLPALATSPIRTFDEESAHVPIRSGQSAQSAFKKIHLVGQENNQLPLQ